ncbi:hypothetical protein [Curtobacterium sp. HSID17257]|uniref:hypothetical protein n=1 Tax=Curtobacterium sp. HSID17257 TaxID=2419510 RepID=UPI000F89759E|nr:hypothetical protein [Curtobacterium sp. HSID17257]RUQ03235.1 hypothetical protein D8M35_12105 [Curtobacterium sp. HSID17257]
MSPLVARWCLVGPAVVLVLVGVLADLPGPARAVLLAAAASCAVLDVLTDRASGRRAPPQVVVTLPTDPVVASGVPGGVPAAATGERPTDDDPPPTPRSRTRTGTGTGTGAGAGGILVLGRRPDGRPERVEVGPSAPCHVVVLGAGAYARAVFDALDAQLTGLSAGPAGADHDAGSDVRVVGDDGPAPGAPPGVRPTPTGTAVAARVDERGRVWATVVLVPGVRMLPRRRDHVLEVTRHGCRVWRDGDQAPVPVEPVLPLLAGDPVAALIPG